MKKISPILMLLAALILTISPVYSANRSSGSLAVVEDATILGIGDCGSSTIQLTGTWSGTVTFEGTTLGNSWVSVVAKNVATGAEATTATANGVYVIPSAGLNQVRARFSTATSGTVVATLQCGNGDNAVNIVTTGATLTTSLSSEKTDDAAFTPATSKVVVIGGEFDDTTPDSVDEGDAGAPRISANRNLYTTIRDAAGNERGLNIDASNNLGAKLAANSGVDIGDVDVLSVIPGTGATNLGKAIDTATGATDTGVLGLCTRDDALSALTPIEGDNVQCRVDANGGLWVSLATKLDSTNDSVTAAVASGGIVSGAIAAGAIAAGATSIADNEDVASADADRGVKVLGVVRATPVDSVGTDGDYQSFQLKNGRVWASATIDAALPAGTNAIGKLAANSGVDIGDVDVTSIAAGNNNIGDVDAIQSGTWTVQHSSSTTDANGHSTYTNGAVSNTKIEVDDAGGLLKGYYIYNANASVCFLQIFNKDSDDVTVGTTVPDLSLGIPATAAANLTIPEPGVNLGTGFTIAATTARGGSTACGSALDVNFIYK